MGHARLRYWIFLTGVLGVICSTIPAHAQKKRLDLEDLQIKGELYGDDRLNLLSRQENELKNFVKFRTNYRQEIVEALPEPRPGVASKLK